MPSFLTEFFAELGIPYAVVQAVVMPALAALLIWGLRAVFLRIVRSRLRRPQGVKRWRRISLYVALVLAGLVFHEIWTASLEQIARLVAAATQLEVSAIQDWLDTALVLFFATAALALAIAATRAMYRALLIRLRAWSMSAKSFRIQRLELVTPERIRENLGGIFRTAYYVALTTAASIYVLFVLNVYPATARFSGAVLTHFANAAVQVGTAVIDYLPNLVYLAIIFTMARYGLKLLRFLMGALGKGDIYLPGFDHEWAEPTYKLGRVVLILFTIMVSYPYLPAAQSEFFRGFSIFFGALLTLGSTAIVGNVISGIVLTYTGSFRVGDRVQIGSTVGDVLEKTLFVTRMRTVENEIVSIPNGVVLSGSVINYERLAKNAGLILTVQIGIGYDVPRSQVRDLLLAAAEATSGVTSTPASDVWQLSLDDYAVTYELRAATNRPERMAAVRSELTGNILDKFHEAGIEIMTPSVRTMRDGSALAIPAEYNPPAGPVAKLRVDIKNAADALRGEKPI